MYYKQPNYFRSFRCRGGSCPESCCIGWHIDWSGDEIDKVRKAAGCSDELKKLLDTSFTKRPESENQFIMALGVGGRCPFLTEDNFCKIQRELGAEYLSHTCTFYPRILTNSGEVIYRSCNQSCPEVIKVVFNDSKSMSVVNMPPKAGEYVCCITNDTPADFEIYPHLRHRDALFDFFYEIISDKKHDVETSIILGALAAQKLTQIVESGRVDEIPEVLKALRPQLHNGAQIKSIENIAPNFHIKFGLVADIFKKLTSLNTLDYLYDEEGKLNITLYNYGERRFKEAFAERDFATRNCALNLLFELGIPFIFKGKSIFENYSIFVTSFALIKLNLIGSAEWVDVNNALTSEEHTAATLEKLDEEICKRMAIIGRTVSHNKQNLKKMLAILKENKMTSPAYLALLVR